QARTAELEQAVQHLSRTQQDLVRSEKLAGLGSLVAGIAHELNTPIGNAVMVTSSLQTAEQQLRDDLHNGLKRSGFARFLGELQESTSMIERSLRRAAERSSSVEEAAGDESSYQRRRFALADVLHELRLTRSASSRKAQV